MHCFVNFPWETITSIIKKPLLKIRRGLDIIEIRSSYLQAYASGISTVFKKPVAEASKGQSLHLSR
jgi:hypothetical protein